MPDIRTCTHIKDDGSPCQAIPVHNTPYCYFHRKYYHPAALPGDAKYQVPLLESHQSIQLALTQLYQAFLSKKIDLKEAQFGLQVLRLAAKAITEAQKSNKMEEAETTSHRPSLAELLLEPDDDDDDDDEGDDEDDKDEDYDIKASATPPQPTPEPKRGIYDPYGCMPRNGSK